MITKKQLKLSHELDSFVDKAKASVAENSETRRSGRGRKPRPDADLWGRHTFIVRDSHLEMLRRVAYWERTSTKELLDKALTAYFNDRKFDPVPPAEGNL